MIKKIKISFRLCHFVLLHGQKLNFASQRGKSETEAKKIAMNFLNRVGNRINSRNLIK